MGNVKNNLCLFLYWLIQISFDKTNKYLHIDVIITGKMCYKHAKGLTN